MDHGSTIEELLIKLKEESISPEELKEFLFILQNPDPNNSFHRYLQDVWENTSLTSDIESSAELISQIHSKLNIDSVETYSKKHSYSLPPKLRSFFRYAAVFVAALGLSWLINHSITTQRKVTGQSFRGSEISVSYGSKSKIILPDGSLVNLNSGSKIQYGSDFETNRKVFIDGEAYFEVKKDTAHPFYVQTSEITIRVLGTVFNVKSYPEENTIETTLVSGSIEIFEQDNKKADKLKKVALLRPNQKAVFFKNKDVGKNDRFEGTKSTKREITENLLSMNVESEVKTDLYTSWKDNRLVFNNEKFGSLIPKLERWFNIEIENKFPELSSSRLTGKFDLETIEQALNALKIITPFNYSIEKNKVLIYK
jgi:ferric-dicitrate binding protein FerR (iron transport regulator)